jgi:flagellar biosynthesis/type III secretory pathway protein FliH
MNRLPLLIFLAVMTFVAATAYKIGYDYGCEVGQEKEFIRLQAYYDHVDSLATEVYNEYAAMRELRQQLIDTVYDPDNTTAAPATL